MALKAWISLIRFPNLLLIFACQQWVYHFHLKAHLPPEPETLSNLDFFYLSINTLLIAAGGFIINNIFDSKLDAAIPLKNPIPNYIKLRDAWILYFLTVALGIMLTVWLADKTNRWEAIFLNPLSALLLFLYSWKLKCSPIVGNIAVSAFTCGVILIIPFAFWPSLKILRALDFYLWLSLIYPILMLALFAFLVNFIREIFKDMEDMESDATQNCNSTAVYYGKPNALKIAQFFWIILILILSFHIYQFYSKQHLIYLFLFIVLPVIVLSIFIFKPLLKRRITLVSLGLKCFMLSGLIYWTLFK
ncbi:MAG: UbiA family prenyltransferase [Saprospiraceae bacterium]|nr:UbiA family prenyltransferase [Saprospiraceae bacterium]